MQALAPPVPPGHRGRLWHGFLVYKEERADCQPDVPCSFLPLFQIREHGCPALPLSLC